MTDQYFTPPEIAFQLISRFRRLNEECIADFAAGDGELLRAASDKWPEARIVATDINVATVQRLLRKHPNWTVGKCDFLSGVSRRRCRALNGTDGKVTLAVLNPPFSCRGGQWHEAHLLSEGSLKVSRAMAFVLNAVNYLSSDGRIAAILPTSCLHSRKDEAAWSILSKWFDIRTHREFGARVFDGCAAKTVIVSLTRRSTPPVRFSTVADSDFRPRKNIDVSIVRGAMPIHRATNGLAGPNWPVVHTTNLRDSKLGEISIWIRDPHRFVAGPAILMPRIGKPDVRKCVLYRARRRLVLSDCVYAVRCANAVDAETLLQRMRANWDEVVKEAYTGTCAPYLTIPALQSVLSALGFNVTEVQATGYKTVD